ncbi:MAG: hypothetical protein P1U56_18260 [Saprospiraceae bacterium]|nr:hypothetical protein [Saprospiraceae bacterium]
MSLIFGYYHFHLRTPEWEEIPKNVEVPNSMQLSQKLQVFHIFFIPFFPMGKKWVYESNDGWKEVDRISKIRLENQMKRKRAPWYAYFGIIALVLIPSLFIFKGYLKSKQNKANAKLRFEQMIAKRNSIIDAPEPETLFMFHDKKYNYFGLNVTSHSKDSIFFKAPRVKLKFRSNRDKWVEYFNENQDKTQVVSVAKTQLKKMYVTEYGGSKASLLKLNLPSLPVEGPLSFISMKEPGTNGK